MTRLRFVISLGIGLLALVGASQLFLRPMIIGFAQRYSEHRLWRDRRKLAFEVRPMISALDEVLQRHGTYPDPAVDADVERLRAILPPEIGLERVADTRRILVNPGLVTRRGWSYYRISSRAYSLSRKLGWDPMLVYECQDGHGRWVFVPGDGSDEQVVEIQ